MRDTVRNLTCIKYENRSTLPSECCVLCKTVTFLDIQIIAYCIEPAALLPHYWGLITGLFSYLGPHISCKLQRTQVCLQST